MLLPTFDPFFSSEFDKDRWLPHRYDQSKKNTFGVTCGRSVWQSSFSSELRRKKKGRRSTTCCCRPSTLFFLREFAGDWWLPHRYDQNKKNTSGLTCGRSVWQSSFSNSEEKKRVEGRQHVVADLLPFFFFVSSLGIDDFHTDTTKAKRTHLV